MRTRALLLAAMSAFALAGCDGAKPTQQAVRIGVSMPSLREPRWKRDLEQLRAEAAARNVELAEKVAANSAAQQLEQCEELLKQGVAVLILAPHDAAAAGAIAREARAAGVKVIAYDRLVLGGPVDLYVSFDNYKVGQLQARALAAAAPRGNYLLLSGAPTDSNAAVYRSGALSVLRPLEKRGEIRITADEAVKDWDPAEAQRLAEAALDAAGGDLQAVLAPNDSTAGGVIAALAKRGLAGRVAVSGQDAQAEAAARIVRGTQTMTVFKDTRQLAAAAFGAALTLAYGGKAEASSSVNNGAGEVPALLLSPAAVTIENLNKALVESGYLRSDEVYGQQKDAR